MIKTMMKAGALLLLCLGLALARDLRPEERWRPASARDLSRYRPRIERYRGPQTAVHRVQQPALPYEGVPRNFDGKY